MPTGTMIGAEFVTYEPITNANFQDAVNLWFSHEANATFTATSAAIGILPR